MELKRTLIWSLIFTFITCFCSAAGQINPQSTNPPTLNLLNRLNQTTTEATTGSSTQLSLFKDPNNSWLVRILRIFFDDIDWAVIEAARKQVVKFLTRVDPLVSRSSTQAPSTGGSSELNRDQIGRFFTSTGDKSWWKPDSSKVDPLALNEASNVRDMLQKVACFVGYMRILNQANEALAELDAAKVVSNLFSSAGKANSSAGYFSRWFG